MNHSRVVATRTTPLSKEEEDRIVSSYKPGEVGYIALARAFGVSQTTIRKILKRSGTPTQTTTSPCSTGKVGYASHALATSAASFVTKRGVGSGRSLWAYRCPKCQSWHIGRLSGNRA
jgi:transposase-like protein